MALRSKDLQLDVKVDVRVDVRVVGEGVVDVEVEEEAGAEAEVLLVRSRTSRSSLLRTMLQLQMREAVAHRWTTTYHIRVLLLIHAVVGTHSMHNFLLLLVKVDFCYTMSDAECWETLVLECATC